MRLPWLKVEKRQRRGKSSVSWVVDGGFGSEQQPPRAGTWESSQRPPAARGRSLSSGAPALPAGSQTHDEQRNWPVASLEEAGELRRRSRTRGRAGSSGVMRCRGGSGGASRGAAASPAVRQRDVTSLPGASGPAGHSLVSLRLPKR